MNPGLVVKLRPSGPWRIGPDSGARNRVDVIYHSDSLYSAVTAAMSRLGSLEDWLQATARGASPAVCFSSCFPFLDGIGFVVPPRTVWPPKAASLTSARVRWKSARFVPLEVVRAILAGEPLDEDRWSVDGASECLVPAGNPGPFRTGVRWNAAVDRLTGASERHATACIEFRAGSGLWTIVGFSDDAAHARWSDPVKAAFRLLADTGFGGERSRGWGRSEQPEFIEGTLPEMILPPPQPPAKPEEILTAEVSGREKPPALTAEAPAAQAPPVEEPPAPSPVPPVNEPSPVPPIEEPPVEQPPVTEPPVEPPPPDPDPEPPAPEPDPEPDPVPFPEPSPVIAAPAAESESEPPNTEAAVQEPAVEPPAVEPPAVQEPAAALPEPVQAAPPVTRPPAPGQPHWLLSLFTPAPADSVDWARGNYAVLARGGRIDSPAGSGELKKQLQMVTEGSVVYAEGAPLGAAADVAPDGFPHPVFRAGFALAIPLPDGLPGTASRPVAVAT